MSRRAAGALLFAAGLAVVGLGVFVKRAYDLRNLMIALHTAATLLALIPGLLLMVSRPKRDAQRDA